MKLTDVMVLKHHKNAHIYPLALPYRIYVPPTLGVNFKLVIFLHGAGERGNDGEKHILYNTHILERIINDPVHGKDTIIIAPQVPELERWGGIYYMNEGYYRVADIPKTNISYLLKDLLDKVILNHYKIKKDQIYIVGLSMGGAGTWDFITRFKEYFAAAIPVCGAVDDRKYDVYKDIPIWAFFSKDDPIVDYRPTDAVMQRLLKDNPNSRYTLYEHEGHGSWVKAWQTPDLLDWLFSQKKPKV
jgi:predicted peptidase